MAKFFKIQLEGGETQWRKIIEDRIDLDSYHEINTRNNFEAFLSLKRTKEGLLSSHILGESPRVIGLSNIINCRISSLREGEKLYPIIEVANICDKKYLGMLKFINSVGTIQMNEAGGWCGLNDFIKTWNGTILEKQETSGEGFPIDNDVNADTLILENSIQEYCFVPMDKIKKSFNTGVIKIIYALREVDKDYISKAIVSAKNIWISSQLQDEKQLNSFMFLFSKISHKNIYLDLDNENTEKIKAHPLFKTNNAIHSINFINQ